MTQFKPTKNARQETSPTDQNKIRAKKLLYSPEEQFIPESQKLDDQNVNITNIA